MDILPEIIKFRHALHRIPELAGQEFKTSQLIRERLASFNLEVLPPFLGTDVVALLHGGKGPGKNVTLRADIDALAIEEATGKPYSSTHAGCMHACGHDGHAAMLMGALELLSSRRNEFAGSIRFIFQPGEENRAMGGDLVAAGVLENPKADIITALHGHAKRPIGTLASRTGLRSASLLVFKITLRGKSGGTGCLSMTRNPVAAAAVLDYKLEGLVGRVVDAHHWAVLAVSRISGGELPNVIPDEAVIEGTIRTYSSDHNTILEEGLRRTVNFVCAMREVKPKIETTYYPCMGNALDATELAKKVIRDIGGCYFEMENPSAGAEDFAYYQKKCPGVYMGLGLGENSPDAHAPYFDFNDETLPFGINYFVNFALTALKGN